MSDYDTDVALWSEHQADLLRRRAAGVRKSNVCERAGGTALERLKALCILNRGQCAEAGHDGGYMLAQKTFDGLAGRLHSGVACLLSFSEMN